MNRRRYGFCAKCGQAKPATQAYVCAECVGTPGLYTNCAVDGEPFLWPASRAYVCVRHLAWRPVNQSTSFPRERSNR